MESGTRAGFTALELMIASVVLFTILAGVYGVFFSGADTYAVGVISTDLERSANRVIGQIADEVSMCGANTLFPTPVPPLSCAGVGFQTSEGFDGSAVIWGPTTLITFDYDLDDPDDGVDNNGNGLVDEGLIVLRHDPGGPNERRVVLTRWVREYLEGEVPNGEDDNGNGLVDEGGLAMFMDGGVWSIRLTLERRDNKGRLVTRTVETSVRPRN